MRFKSSAVGRPVYRYRRPAARPEHQLPGGRGRSAGSHRDLRFVQFWLSGRPGPSRRIGAQEEVDAGGHVGDRVALHR
ncbi:hypothetical protein G6F35_019033 [Rhizopus arrhizus]|nr:hypothetical protein G6F35_019033 [Rhizopus arrhizus]